MLQLISTAKKIIKAQLGAKFIGEKIRFTSNWRLNYGGAINQSSKVVHSVNDRFYYNFFSNRGRSLRHSSGCIVKGLNSIH